MSVRSPGRGAGASSRAGESTRLPELSKAQPVQMNKEAVMDEINALRLQVTKMDAERVRIKSKKARTKQIVHDRQAQIKKAMAVSDNEQVTIKTASDSTLSQLRRNISSLENTLEVRENELDALRKNDRLAKSDELQVEVLEYYLEMERLQKQLVAVHDAVDVIDSEKGRLNKQIADGQVFDKHISECQKQIGQLADKIVAYRQGQQRIETNLAVEKVNEKPSTYNSERKAIEREIEEIKQMKEAVKEEIEVALENDKKNKEYLQKIIDDQAEKIARAIEEQKKQQEEDHKREEEEKQRKKEARATSPKQK